MAKITNPSKLLPSAKSTAITRVGKPNILAKTSPLSKGLLAKRENKDATDANNKLVKVDKFLKSDLIVSKKKAEVKRKETEKEDFAEAEKKLETPQSKKFKLPGISLPSLGFMDRVKRFIFFTALGWALPKILEFLPKLQGFANIIGGVYNFAEGLFGKLFDGFMSLVKFGGDLKDKTLGFIATAKAGVGGNYQKEFDKLEKQFNTFVNASIIAGVLAADIGGAAVDEFNKQRKKGQKPEPGKPGSKAGAKAGSKVTTGRGGEKPKGKPKVTTGKGGKVPSWWNKMLRGPFAKLKGPLSKFAGAAVPGLGAAVGAADAKARFAAGDKIGGSIASVSAGIDGISTILALTGVGAVVAVPLSVVSMGLDAILLINDIGKVIKETWPMMGWLPTFRGGGRVVRKYQGGGTTRGGRPVGAPKRRGITPRKRRTVFKLTPPKSQPGKDIGGEKEIKKLYPDPDKMMTLDEFNRSPMGQGSYNYNMYKDDFKKRTKKPNPYKALTGTAKILKDIPLVGGLMGAAVDIALGQKPDVRVYRSIASGIGSLVESLANQKTNQSITSLMRDIRGFAEGGSVPTSRQLRTDTKSLSSGDLISKLLETTIIQKVNDAIQNLEKELNLKGGKGKDGEGPPGPPGEGETPGAKLREGNNAQIEADLLEYFTALYGKPAALGIVANLQRESGYRTRTPENKTFEGMAQWDRKDRWPRFEKWAKSKGLDPYNRNTQAQYIAVELKQYGTDKRLKQAKSPEWAAQLFYEEFEKGADTGKYSGSDTETKHLKFLEDIKKRNPDIGKRSGEVVVKPAAKPLTPSGQYVPSEMGTKLSGDLGDFMKSWGGVPGSIHQHSRHGGQGTRSYPSYHNVDRAIDLGANANEQGPILKKIEEFNKLKGVKPVQLLHAGNDSTGDHDDHVHVAYQGGGIVPRKPNRPIPNSFASYETYGSGMMIAIQPIIVEKQVPVSGGGNKMIAFPVPVAVNSNMDNLSFSRG